MCGWLTREGVLGLLAVLDVCVTRFHQRVRYFASDIIIITRNFLNVAGQMTSCSVDIQQTPTSLCMSEDPVGVSAYLPEIQL